MGLHRAWLSVGKQLFIRSKHKEAAEKSFLFFWAAHGAAPQFQINNFLFAWGGAMPCQRLFR
jgi:hypothetical protein